MNSIRPIGCRSNRCWMKPWRAQRGRAQRHSCTLLREQNLREVGQVLGISEDAAQKRVSRAVERLRAFFAKTGSGGQRGSLGLLVSAHAVEAAPAGLAANLAVASMGAASSGWIHTLL